MAATYPQADLPRGISGGADVWDDGAAGGLLFVEFIHAPSIDARVSWVQLEIPATGGGAKLKYWTGAAWVAKPLKRWTGSAWVAATMKRWNGAAWAAT
jgi:hypothetical protein